MTGGDLAVEARGLARAYRRKGSAEPVWALDDFDLAVAAGEVHALLGPNGAGKTTLCKILTTVLTPTSGEARVCGHDVVRATREVRRLIGIVFGGDRGLYVRLSARHNLDYWASLHGLRGRERAAKVTATLERVGLLADADQPAETYSRGMKQRLHLARALLSDCRVLILDEPTTGMDPVAGHAFRELVAAQAAEGRTVLLTTHDMAEAQAVSDRVSFIDHGRLLATMRPHELAGAVEAAGQVEAFDVPEALLAELSTDDGVTRVETLAGGLVRFWVRDHAALARTVSTLTAGGVVRLQTRSASLEDVYLKLIGGRGFDV